MQLRHYQQEACYAARASLKAAGNPALQLATGTGKSLIIADLAHHARRNDQVVWVLTHIQQLIEQNANTYQRYSDDPDYGIVCAGLDKYQYDRRVIFATVQSIRRRALSGQVTPPGLIIIDEAHRVPHNSSETSMYAELLKAFPGAGRVGMTATPWRMDNGLIYGEGEQYWFDNLAYSYPVKRAVEDGYLCPLIGVESSIQLEVEALSDPSRGNDYVAADVDELETEDWLRAVARSVGQLAAKRRHIAVYCPTIAAASRSAQIIAQVTGWETAIITGDMSPDLRAEVLFKFRSGIVRVLCSVDTITTGFDLPALDCIVCLRPTVSSSLWVQIQGRGTRLHPDKKNCLVLDYVGNLQRLGGVDMYDTYVREVDGEAVEQVMAVPRPLREKRKLLPGLTSLKPIDPMTGQEAGEGAKLTVAVHAVSAISIQPRGRSSPILMVQYTCSTPENARINATRFVNTERPTSEDWGFFKARCLAVNLPARPQSVLWQVRNARQPSHAVVRKGGRYWNVIQEVFP